MLLLGARVTAAPLLHLLGNGGGVGRGSAGQAVV